MILGSSVSDVSCGLFGSLSPISEEINDLSFLRQILTWLAFPSSSTIPHVLSSYLPKLRYVEINYLRPDAYRAQRRKYRRFGG